MTRIEALEELAAQVEGGFPNGVGMYARRLASMARDMGDTFLANDVEKAFNGSIGAAFAFHAVVLPKTAISISTQSSDRPPFSSVMLPGNGDHDAVHVHKMTGNVARVLLLADLKVLIEQEKAK